MAPHLGAQTWIDRNLAEEEDRLSIGPSRAPPKAYLHCSGAVAIIKKEMRDLAEVARGGIDPLNGMHRKDARLDGLPFARTPLIVREISTGIWMPRLCLRGDLVNVQTEIPTPPPYGAKRIVANVVIRHYSPAFPHCNDGGTSWPFFRAMRSTGPNHARRRRRNLRSFHPFGY